MTKLASILHKAEHIFPRRTIVAGKPGEESWMLEHDWQVNDHAKQPHKPPRVEQWKGPYHGKLLGQILEQRMRLEATPHNIPVSTTNSD